MSDEESKGIGKKEWITWILLFICLAWIGVGIRVFGNPLHMIGDWFKNPFEKLADKEMEKIKRKIVEDQIQQYIIADRHGSRMDACVQAGFVSAAMLQAKMEKEYSEWKKIETTQCKAAGIR
ncbi:MAG: hypothetical protein LLH30_09970 [Candidatus Manganitrophus sp. SA1]|nr:hypothetical protein [Candidatus Manganitrophus morganii]